MGLEFNSDWLVMHDGNETRVFWCGHDVSKYVTSVRFERDAGERAKATIGVLANVSLTINSLPKQTEVRDADDGSSEDG